MKNKHILCDVTHGNCCRDVFIVWMFYNCQLFPVNVTKERE